jgi:soluble lytic murein transglycosylase
MRTLFTLMALPLFLLATSPLSRATELKAAEVISLRDPVFDFFFLRPTGKPDPANLQRLSHARELLGRFYDSSVVRTGEQLDDVKKFVRESVRRELPDNAKRQASRLADTILSESRKYGFDPIFLMAVIKNESSFRPKVRGTSGEIGLMQLMPATAREIARREKIKWRGAVKTLEDPQTNVRIGAAYLNFLRERLDSHGRLYLSAYNMGMGNLKHARARSIWPKDYVQAVMHRYIGYYREIRDSLSATSRKLSGPTEKKLGQRPAV